MNDHSLHLDLLGQLLPEALLVLTALAVLILDVRWFRDLPVPDRMRRAAMGCTAGLFGAWLVLRLNLANGDAPESTFVLEPLSQFLKGVLVLLSIATALIAASGRFTRHVGEFFALMLLATVGLMLLVGTANLLMVFVALELVSLSLYVMTAFHDERPAATEAALKYFLFGGLAASFLLFGFSLLYGLTGSLQLSVIGSRLGHGPGGPLLWTAMAMVLAGFGFKVALAPFHLWAPDTYQGAPTPAAAFIASGSKIAGFLLLIRLLHSGFGEATAGNAAETAWLPGWVPLIAVLSTASMLVGNLTALQQTDLRRLLAYSAVAQAGYAALGLLDPSPDSRAAVLYFAITYAITVLGAFGVISALESDGTPATLSGVTGLGCRSPFLAACLTVFVLSLAGIPPLAGFFGKLFVFIQAIARGDQPGRLWIVVVAVATSAVALFYYLRILKQALVAAPAAPAPPIRVPTLTAWVLAVLALATLALGILPNLLLHSLR